MEFTLEDWRHGIHLYQHASFHLEAVFCGYNYWHENLMQHDIRPVAQEQCVLWEFRSSPAGCY